MANESPNELELLLATVNRAAKVLVRRSVKYALIGGIATGYRSRSRSTKDVDFIFSVPQISLPPLLEDFQADGFEFDLMSNIKEWTQHNFMVLACHGIRVDCMRPSLPVYQHVVDRASPVQIEDQPVNVASAEGLIVLKLLAFRLRDQLDIQELIFTNESLDIAWIKSEWQALHPLDDPRMTWFLERYGEGKK